MSQDFIVQYGYLIGSLMGGIVWFLFYYLRKDLRKELLWCSLIVLPFALCDIFFFGLYWNPGSAFSLMERYGFGIESFIFTFFYGGLAGVSYEVLARKKLTRTRKPGSFMRGLPFIVLILVLTAGIKLGMNEHLLSLIVASFALAVVLVLARHNLWKESILGGICFGLIYFVILAVFVLIFPSYIPAIYNTNLLWGVYLLGVPLEEIVFGIFVGAAFAPLYEFVMGYKVTKA